MIRTRINSPFPLVFFSICLLWAPVSFSKNAHVVPDNRALDDESTLQLSMFKPLPKSIGLEKDDVAIKTDSAAQPTDVIVESDDSESAIKITPTVVLTPKFSDEEISNLRQLFLQAEEALKYDDDASYFLLVEKLKDYPLYPYLQYLWLKQHLDHDRQIKHFLETYNTSRYASPLKRKWLHRLARNKQWDTFLAYFSKTSNTTLNCYYHRAQYNTGDKQTALEGAAKLWVVGKSQPKACNPLFTQLKKSPLFNDELLWKRFDAALRNNKTSLASYVRSLMNHTDSKTAKSWLNLHRNPQRYINAFLKQAETAQTPLKFSHAINRLANKDIHKAIALWDKNKQRFAIDKKQADRLEKRLALKLSYKKETGAYERLGGLSSSDHKSQTQRIRLALYEQNWPRVITAIEDLSPENQKLEKWQYWLARSYQETGRALEAEMLFSELSGKRDFYGYLAADKLDRLYQLSDNPIDVTPEAIANIRYRNEFRVAFEFMVLDRINDAKLQWWHALRQIDKSEIPAAAKLAQQWQWDEIAIFTIAKVKQWDDIEMRFPLSYSEKIHENAIEQNLNPVILFGLVRRESAFNKDARSPVGARGLMQIMPRTGRQIAKDLNERWQGKKVLFNPVKNLKYGSYYYQKLLNQFDGNYAIALAAYNAGPSRVKKWLPDESVPADVWIETIPYRETRDYVTSVLVYAMIYQQRIQTQELTMNDLTREVLPLAMMQSL